MLDRFRACPTCRRAAPAFLCLAAVAGLPAAAHAQDDVVRRAERAIRTSEMGDDFRLRTDTSLSTVERAYLDFGGYTSFTALWLNDADGNSRRMLQPEVGLYARAIIDNAHTLFARATFQYRAYSEGDSFDGRGDRWTVPMMDRYFYEFDLRKAVETYQGETLGFNVNVRTGKQFVDWGASLALSETLYAVRSDIEFAPWLSVNALVGFTPDWTVNWDASQKNFDSRTERLFLGAMITGTLPGGQQIYAYELYTQDYSDEERAESLPLNNVDFTYNAHYLGVGAAGSVGSNWDLLGEFVVQAGVSQTDPLRGPQEQEQVLAFAARAQATYVFRDERNTRAQFEALFGSGDDDRLVSTDTIGGNLAGTKDHAFNSLGFANTGLAFAPTLSNLWTLRAGISSYPLPASAWTRGMQIGVDGYIFNKVNEDGGFDEPTKDKMFLGGEIDVYLNYRVTSDVAFTVRYGVFFPGEAIADTKQARQFVLLGVTYSF